MLFFQRYKDYLLYTLIIILSVSIGYFYLKNITLSNTIDSKNNQIKALELSIDKQNNSIKIMNDDFNKQKDLFNQKYKELQDNQKTKIQYIEKQSNYVSPQDKTEVEASRLVIQDFLKERRK